MQYYRIHHLGTYGQMVFFTEDGWRQLFAWQIVVQTCLFRRFCIQDRKYLRSVAKLELQDEWYKTAGLKALEEEIYA